MVPRPLGLYHIVVDIGVDQTSLQGRYCFISVTWSNSVVAYYIKMIYMIYQIIRLVYYLFFSYSAALYCDKALGIIHKNRVVCPPFRLSRS